MLKLKIGDIIIIYGCFARVTGIKYGDNGIDGYIMFHSGVFHAGNDFVSQAEVDKYATFVRHTGD